MEDNRPHIHNSELDALAQALVAAARKMLQVKGGINLSVEPEAREKRIVQFGKRMRVDGLEKFGERTVFAVVRFYRDKSRMEKLNAVGCLILYIPVNDISKLLHILEYPRIDEDDDAAVLDGCGTIANMLAGYFIREMTGMGYVHLEMSPFESYINTAVDGVEFSADQEYKSEIELEIKGEKKMVLELTMAPVPRY